MKERSGKVLYELNVEETSNSRDEDALIMKAYEAVRGYLKSMNCSALSTFFNKLVKDTSAVVSTIVDVRTAHKLIMNQRRGMVSSLSVFFWSRFFIMVNKC